jgi:hypothetical protein
VEAVVNGVREKCAVIVVFAIRVTVSPCLCVWTLLVVFLSDCNSCCASAFPKWVSERNFGAGR